MLMSHNRLPGERRRWAPLARSSSAHHRGERRAITPAGDAHEVALGAGVRQPHGSRSVAELVRMQAVDVGLAPRSWTLSRRSVWASGMMKVPLWWNRQRRADATTIAAPPVAGPAGAGR